MFHDACQRVLVLSRNQCISISARTSSFMTHSRPDASSTDGDDFRKLDLYKPKEVKKRKKTEIKFDLPNPRYTRMPVDQDWTSVWPTAQSFRPSVVPLPLRQGYLKKGAAPGKFANLELMKIPNFLHLTPSHLAKHCQVLKRECSQPAS